jgi:hypothetical protein
MIRVRQLRYSTVFSPRSIIPAHGWRMDRARVAGTIGPESGGVNGGLFYRRTFPYCRVSQCNSSEHSKTSIVKMAFS